MMKYVHVYYLVLKEYTEQMISSAYDEEWNSYYEDKSPEMKQPIMSIVLFCL